MKDSPGPRVPATLRQPVHQMLNKYALAASAAGVSMLALAQPSEAKVVYTKVHHKIGLNGVYGLDLNNDGTKDFIIQEIGSSGGSGSNFLGVLPAYGNAVAGSKGMAGALIKNMGIGRTLVFNTGHTSEGNVMVRAWEEPGRGTGGGSTGSSGQWINVTNRYLGLKFKIAGKTHYGWARLSVQVNFLQITGYLTGYAYETVPNKKIRAGQTTGGAEEPGSLGNLALGAKGVARGRGL